MELHRIKRELEKLTTSKSNEIIVNLKNESLHQLDVQIIGPKDSPYDQGVFKLEVIIPNTYPISPPSVKFETKVYHPNIDNNGRICLDLLYSPPKGSWRPTVTLVEVLNSIRMLMVLPNPKDPLMPEIAEEYMNCQESYFNKAKQFTKKYAC